MRERYSRLKMASVTVAAMFMKRKDIIRHSAIASENSPMTTRLLSNLMFSLPFPPEPALNEKHIELNFSFKTYGI